MSIKSQMELGSPIVSTLHGKVSFPCNPRVLGSQEIFAITNERSVCGGGGVAGVFLSCFLHLKRAMFLE